MAASVMPGARAAACRADTFSQGIGASELANSIHGSAVTKRRPVSVSVWTARALPTARSRTTGWSVTQSRPAASFAMSSSAVASWNVPVSVCHRSGNPR